MNAVTRIASPASRPPSAEERVTGYAWHAPRSGMRHTVGIIFHDAR